MDRREEHKAIDGLAIDGLLAYLAKSNNDKRIREMASGLRDGSLSWREALSTSQYAEPLYSHVQKFAGWYDSKSENERAAEVDQVRVELDRLNAEAN